MTRIAFCFIVILASTQVFATPITCAFTSADGSFLSAEGGGGGALHANRLAQGPWERFYVFTTCKNDCGPFKSGDEVCIQTDNGHFVVAEGGGGRETNANRIDCGPWERFHIFLLGNTPAGLFPVFGEFPHHGSIGIVPVAIRASDSSWVTAEGGGGGAVNANRPAIGAWERFNLRSIAP